MEYTEFLDKIKEQIKDFLPEKYAEGKADIVSTLKNNGCVMDGLVIRTEDINISPNIYLNGYYEAHENGMPLEDVLTSIAEVYTKNSLEQSMDLEGIYKLEDIKDKLGCRLINLEANAEFLQDKPHTIVEDLAVSYTIIVGQEDGVEGSIAVTNQLMQEYGITVEELHSLAVENQERINPHDLKSLSDTVIDMTAEKMAREEGIPLEDAHEIASAMLPEMPMDMYVLSNTNKVYGAATILNDEIRQEIADKMGDFYVIPSSVHETLIIPKEMGMSVEDLEGMIQQVNSTEVVAQDKLSDHLYEYDAKDHELFRSDRAEERAAEKAVAKEAAKEGIREEKRPSLKMRLEEKQAQVKANEKTREVPTKTKDKDVSLG